VSRYSKIHPFSYAHEDEHYAAGDKHLTVDIDGLRVTVFICYDLRFADEFWESALGTDLYVVPANWPEPRREHWRALLRARAIENQAYVVGANRVGAGQRYCAPRRFGHHRPARAHAGRSERRRGRARPPRSRLRVLPQYALISRSLPTVARALAWAPR